MMILKKMNECTNIPKLIKIDVVNVVHMYAIS